MIDPYTGCPDRPVEPPEENRTYLDVCCVCGEPIVLDETYYDFDGDTVHPDCLFHYTRSHRKEAHA